jgi:hypothetical protein
MFKKREVSNDQDRSLLLRVAAHIECQRRTGSAFGASTYFPKDQVRTERTRTPTIGDSGNQARGE